MKRCAAAVLLLLGACAPLRIPEPTLEIAGGSAETLDRLRSGRRLYVDKCSGCHSLYSVDAFGDREWRDSVTEMIKLKKVTLADDERARIELYLTTANGRD